MLLNIIKGCQLAWPRGYRSSSKLFKKIMRSKQYCQTMI